MDITAEKEDIIRRFQLVHDVDLIKAIKSMLDFGLLKQDREDQDDEIALNASIDRGINDSVNGNVRSYEDFIADVRKRKRA